MPSVTFTATRASQEKAPALDACSITWQALKSSQGTCRTRALKNPGPKIENISDFSTDPALGRELKVILAVKSVRIEPSYSGNYARLPLSDKLSINGFVALFKLNGSTFHQEDDDPCDIKKILPVDSPRGVALNGDQLLVSCHSQLRFFDRHSFESLYSLSHPLNLFIKLHDVAISHDKRRALIASTEVGSVFEINLECKSVCWSWLPWEKGFGVSTVRDIKRRIYLEDGQLKLETSTQFGVTTEACPDGVGRI